MKGRFYKIETIIDGKDYIGFGNDYVFTVLEDYCKSLKDLEDAVKNKYSNKWLSIKLYKNWKKAVKKEVVYDIREQCLENWLKKKKVKNLNKYLYYDFHSSDKELIFDLQLAILEATNFRYTIDPFLIQRYLKGLEKNHFDIYLLEDEFIRIEVGGYCIIFVAPYKIKNSVELRRKKITGKEFNLPKEVDVIVTRHKALEEVLRPIYPNVEVKTHISNPEEVKNKKVIGILPLHLACLTEFIVTPTLNIPKELRGKELDVSTMVEYLEGFDIFKVEKLD